MDTLDTYRQAIKEILEDYARDPYSYGDLRLEILCDRERDRYMLVVVGWQEDKRVHGALIHCDIIDGKIWIQSDGTEEGVAAELLHRGIPKDRIVLGYRMPELRPHTDFAIA